MNNNHDLWVNEAIKQTVRNVEYWRESRKSDWSNARSIYKKKSIISWWPFAATLQINNISKQICVREYSRTTSICLIFIKQRSQGQRVYIKHLRHKWCIHCLFRRLFLVLASSTNYFDLEKHFKNNYVVFNATKWIIARYIHTSFVTWK